MQPPRQWNLFARELNAILSAHGLRLGHLDNRADVHPERVRRLQQSLREPRFHVLPPTDIENICSVLQLTHAEIVRLKAAILATAVEEKLMDRINPDDALVAAEQLLPVLAAAVQAHDGEDAGIGQIKADSMSLTQRHTPLELFESALSLIDSALISLNLANETTGNARVRWAREARINFRASIDILSSLDEDLQATDTWRMWYGEAQLGLQQAAGILA